MSRQLVMYNVDENITLVTIDRPPVNALDPNMTLQLGPILETLQANLFGELLGTEEVKEVRPDEKDLSYRGRNHGRRNRPNRH